MTSSPGSFKELHQRVNKWRENIIDHTNKLSSSKVGTFSKVGNATRDPPANLSSSSSVAGKTYGNNEIQLRPTARRTGLQEISVNAVNQVTRKRKGDKMAGRTEKKMLVEDERGHDSAPGSRGRGTRGRGLATGRPIEMPQQEEHATTSPSRPLTRGRLKAQEATSPFKLPVERFQGEAASPYSSISSPEDERGHESAPGSRGRGTRGRGLATGRSIGMPEQEEYVVNSPSRPRVQHQAPRGTSPSKPPVQGSRGEAARPYSSVSSPARPASANPFQSPDGFSSPSEPSSANRFQPPHLSPPPTPCRRPSPKRSAKPAEQPFTDSEMDIVHLQACNPPVYKYTVDEFRDDGMSLPIQVERLYRRIDPVDGCIPSEFKDDYDAKLSSFFLPGQTPYEECRLPALKERMDHFVEMSRLNDHYPVHERQWGYLVSQFLTEVQLMSDRNCIAMNVETIPIQPEEMRPKRQDNAPFNFTDAKSERTGSMTGNERVARMVDWSFGFKVPREEAHAIKCGMRKVHVAERLMSFNQTTSWSRDFFLLFDIEVKKTNQPDSPEVQLAVWISGALLKKRVMKWNTSMPMPGIVVEGGLWRMYLFFEMGTRLIMLGPFKMGDTSEIAGTWSILYHLYILMKWGTPRGPWHDWYQKFILGGARG